MADAFEVFFHKDVFAFGGCGRGCGSGFALKGAAFHSLGHGLFGHGGIKHKGYAVGLDLVGDQHLAKGGGVHHHGAFAEAHGSEVFLIQGHPARGQHDRAHFHVHRAGGCVDGGLEFTRLAFQLLHPGACVNLDLGAAHGLADLGNYVGGLLVFPGRSQG